MDDIRRLNALRARARAGHYCCGRAARRAGDARVRELFERTAGSRLRLAAAIDAFLTSQPWEDHSRLAQTSLDRLVCLRRRLRALLVLDRDRHALHWLAADTARLRHGIEICRALSWSLEISDLLTAQLDELKALQRETTQLARALRDDSATAAETLALP
jgi:hypothetical protein